MRLSHDPAKNKTYKEGKKHQTILREHIVQGKTKIKCYMQER